MPRTIAKTHEKVRVSDLNVDTDVQRMLNPAQVTKLEAEWDPTYSGTITVSRRDDGSLWIVDGQHRAEAAKRLDPNMLLDAEVHEGLTHMEEALMFLRLNRDRKPPRPYDNYRVSLTAGLAIETSVEMQVTSRGLKVAGSPSANQVGAVEACRWIVVRDKLKTGLLHDTLKVNEEAWGRTTESWDNMILRAVASVIHKNRGNIDLDRLTRTLAKRHPSHWKAAAVSNAPGGGGSESRSNRLVEVIVTGYNSGLRSPARMIVA